MRQKAAIINIYKRKTASAYAEILPGNSSGQWIRFAGLTQGFAEGIAAVKIFLDRASFSEPLVEILRIDLHSELCVGAVSVR